MLNNLIFFKNNRKNIVLKVLLKSTLGTRTNLGQKNVGQDKRRTGTNVGQGHTWDRDKRGTGTNVGQGQT